MTDKEIAMHGYEFGVYVGMNAAKQLFQQVVLEGGGLCEAIERLDVLVEASKTEKVDTVLADTDGAALFKTASKPKSGE